MFCERCGSNLNEQDRCPNCDNNYQQYNQYNTMVAPNHDSYAIAALICGILSVMGMPFLGIVAWIFGNKYKETGETANYQLANIGKILGIVGTIMFAFVLIFLVLYFVFVFGLLGLGTMASLSA